MAGGVLAWQFKNFNFLLSPVAPLLMWPFMRLTTPRQGIRSRRLSATPEIGYLWFLLIWCVVSIVGGLAIPNNVWAVCGLMIPWFAVLLFQAYRVDRRKRATEDARASLAVEEWNRLQGPDVGSGQDGGGFDRRS